MSSSAEMAGESKHSKSGKEPISYRKPRVSNGRTKKAIPKNNPAEKKERKPAKSRARKLETLDTDFRADPHVHGSEGLRTSRGTTKRAAAKTSADRIADVFAVQPVDDALTGSMDDWYQSHGEAFLGISNDDGDYGTARFHENPSSVRHQSISDKNVQYTFENEVSAEPTSEESGVEALAPGKFRVIIRNAAGCRSFVVNKSDLIQQSTVIAEFVRANESENMTETNDISLEDISADTFSVFQVWLETGHVKIPPKFKHVRFSGSLQGDGTPAITFVKDLDPILDLLADCWLIGASMGSLAFINNVMCELRNTYKSAYEYSLPLALGNVNKICTNSIKGSQLRKLIIDVLHYCLEGPDLAAAAEQGLIPLEIMSGVAADAVDNEVKGVLRKAPWEINPKVYFVWEGGRAPPSPVLDF